MSLAGREPGASRVYPWPARVLGIAAGTLIALATLTPLGGDASQPLWCITCGRWVQDGVDNIALFVPLGVALALSGWRPHAALVIGAVTSVGIELAQHWLVSGRDTAILDVVTNATGTWLGAAACAGRWWWPVPQTARRLAAVGTLLWAAQLALDPLAFRPPTVAVPSELRLRRRPVGDDTTALGFRLLETRLAETRYEWELPPAVARQAYDDGHFALTVRGVVLRDSPEGFLTTGIYGPNREVVGVVTVEGGMARGRPALRAASWGLIPPYAEVPLPDRLVVGDTIDATMRRAVHGVTVTAVVRRGGDVREAQGSAVPSVRRSWRLLAPEWVGRRAARYGVAGLIDWAWLLALPALLSLWVTAAAVRPVVRPLAAALALGAAHAVTRYTGAMLSYPLWWDWSYAVAAYLLLVIVLWRWSNSRGVAGAT